MSADIQEMFHQVKMREADKDAQRFLWKPAGTNITMEYRMEVMSFGAACSPTTAQYVMRLNAEKFAETHPIAVQAIKSSHYVDDLLISLNTEEEAHQLIDDIVNIQRAAGFELKKWRTSHRNVIHI